ncbi:uncharacterized protein LOC144650544 [Oculina patagonica]
MHALVGSAALATGEHPRTGQGIEKISGMGEDKIDGQAHIAKTANLNQDEQRKLKLPNGVEINFEHIIALAGDHYGIPEHPVIDPSNFRTDEVDSGLDSGRRKRFLDAYNTLARTPKDKMQKELEKLLAALEKEIQTGESVSNKEWDEITGGYWVGPVPFKFGRMMKLAQNNHDHFQPYAREAYLTGHQLAMDKAREASKNRGNEGKRLDLLHEALSLEAFALHFLTDSFASGHIRVPRVELGKATFLGRDGDLLCMYMHDEDGDYGLRVTNARGDKWIAYGDGTLLEEKSEENLKLVKEAVKTSVDQVYEAYCHPNKTLDTAVVTNLIPFVDPEEKNNYPLFQVKDGKLHRRSNINNLQDPKTVTNWWGLTSAVMRFATYKPKNPAIEAP